MNRYCLFPAIVFCLRICPLPSPAAPIPRAGEPVDIVPFGYLCTWTGISPLEIQRRPAKTCESADGRSVFVPGESSPGKEPHIGIEWDFPQDVAAVEVEFASIEDASLPGEEAMEYWHDSWPPQDRGGWTRLDDPFSGSWKRPTAEFRREANRWVYEILPLSEGEISESGGVRATYRRTYKIRVVFPDGEFPGIGRLRVFTRHKWEEGRLRIETGVVPGSKPLRLTSVGVFCGHVLSPLKLASSTGNRNRYDLGILYSDCPDDSPDRTIVTLRWGDGESEGISFLPVEAIGEGIFVPDLGLWITKKDGPAFQESELSRFPGKARTIWEKVSTEPEQTYQRARAEIPPLKKTAHKPYGSYTPLGCEGNRQEFGVLYNGNVFIQKGALKSPGREDERMLWPGYDLLCKIGTGNPPDFREREEAARESLLEGYLPVVITEWENGGVIFRESAVAALLVAEDADPARLRGDETSVLLLSLTAQNSSDKAAEVEVWFSTSPAESLEVKDGLVQAMPSGGKVETYPQPPLRCLVDIGSKGGASVWRVSTAKASSTSHVGFETTIEAKTGRQIVFKIPFLSSLSDEEMARLHTLDFDRELLRTVRYWKSRLDQGATIRVPNPLLNDFVRAQLWHILVTADRDVDTGLTMLPAATFHYKVCANEACHQIRSLDLRGHARVAEEYLEPFVQLQGTRPLHGRFRSSNGVLHGLCVKEGVDYQTFNYNLDHGFVLWMLCEHFKLTGDADWLNRVAPNIVRACDFIVRERQATKLTDPDGGKAWEYGLLPPGHLEDNPEFLHWYAVNAYASRGMTDAAQVLAEIGHPDAERIRIEAAQYLADVRRAARWSMLLSPVVNQGKGAYIPFQPTRCHVRGRDLGWIRDCLYGPIHLIACGVYPWNSPEATWILEDADNNVFVSPERGLGIDTDRFWFSHGGMTLQPNLVPTPIVYVHRDEPERAIRCFYNTFAASVYEDVRSFCEWLPARFGRGGGPFYKTPDESAFIVWLRYLLTVEDGDKLTLCPAAPREWFADGKEINVERLPTYFGEVSFQIVSRSDKGEIRAHVTPPSRRLPNQLRLRIRHPHCKPIRSVRLDNKPHLRFDAAGELVFLPPTGEKFEIVIRY